MNWIETEKFGYYGQCSSEGVSPSLLGFVLYLFRQLIPVFLCWLFGHKPVDTSAASPESGTVSISCQRCGMEKSTILY